MGTKKAKLVQGGDGTAVPAEMVGEKKETLLTTASSYTATQDVWVTQAETITLTAGVWLVMYFALIEAINVSASPTLSIRMYNTTDAAELSDARSCVSPGLGTGVTGYFTASNYTTVAIASSKTYRLEIACNAADTIAKGKFLTNITGGITGNDASNKILAVRLA